MGGAPDWTATFTQRGEMCGRRLQGGWNAQVSGSCIDMHLIDMLPSQIIEHFGHLGICFGVAAREQQAHCGYLWIGVARHWLDWQQKAGTAPRASCLQDAGAAGVAAGTGGVCSCWWKVYFASLGQSRTATMCHWLAPHGPGLVSARKYTGH